MYAVIENEIVIDCAVEKDKIIISPLTQKKYDMTSMLIEVTAENSPFEIGMRYKK